MLQFRGQELNGKRQARGGENFFVNAFENLLGGHVGGHALAEDAKEVRLLDVLFPFKDVSRKHALIISPRRHQGQLCPCSHAA